MNRTQSADRGPMACRHLQLVPFALVLLLTPAARADIVIYHIPNTNLVVKLQGSTSVNPGSRTINFRHPRFSSSEARLIMSLDDAQIYKGPSPAGLFQRRLAAAVRTGKAAEVMTAGEWALRHGLLDDFYQCAAKARELDPQNADARRVLELKQKIDQPLPSSPEQQEYMRKLIPVPGMHFTESKHFVLMHDTPDKPGRYRKKSRAEERLDLLELVYESFLMKFFSRGVELQIPPERLMVVLFNEERDFRDYSVRQDKELERAAGYWNSRTNVAIFYDHGTSPMFKAIKQLDQVFQQMSGEAKKAKTLDARDIVRMANSFSLLVEIAQENSDIEVVTHECTHQMAGNTGLLPRSVMIPTWVHEGLATYFEAPNDAAWSGIGAVNEERIEWYRALAEHDREHSNIDFIVGDQIFDFAGSHGSVLHGYGQAWALTHFLMQRHFTELMKFYRRLGEMPPDVLLSADVLNKLFDEVFGSDHSRLDLEWRKYMRGLKTDWEEFRDQVAQDLGK